MTIRIATISKFSFDVIEPIHPPLRYRVAAWITRKLHWPKHFASLMVLIVAMMTMAHLISMFFMLWYPGDNPIQLSVQELMAPVMEIRWFGVKIWPILVFIGPSIVDIVNVVLMLSIILREDITLLVLATILHFNAVCMLFSSWVPAGRLMDLKYGYGFAAISMAILLVSTIIAHCDQHRRRDIRSLIE